MSFYTDWFVADASEAEAVASIVTTEEHSFEDWPHLALKDVAEVPLTLLRGILRGQPGTALDVDGGSLFLDEVEEDGGHGVRHPGAAGVRGRVGRPAA